MANIRGIRGAIVVPSNTKAGIVTATTDLLKEMVKLNKVREGDIASIIFSATPDLNAEFPATAARRLGWTRTPLLCTCEIKVPGSLKRCIRALMHVNSSRSQSQIKHVYMGDAKKLRPDLG